MTAVHSPPATGIELRGLVKSSRTPAGVVQAVRDVDIAIPATWRSAAPRGARPAG